MMTDDQAQSLSDDPFLFDSEQLQEIAKERVIRDGLRDFREKCVMRVMRDEDCLSAEVEDAETEEVVRPELCHGDEVLQVTCTCGVPEQTVCRHSVAALYAYAEQVRGVDALLGAVESAIEERSQRGRNEVKVKHLGGEPWFGTWRAASITPSGHFPRRYQVHIRSLHHRANYCTCPDFATNQLGTCKHIEAVLHRVRRRRDYKRIKDLTPPYPYVYLSWEAADPPRITLQRTGSVASDLESVLERYFDAAGSFKGRLPDDFFRFAEAVSGRPDIDVGEDAAGHARHLSARAAQQVRAGEIRSRIEASGGHLPGVRARLYPYQVEGVAFLAANGRALLADDMGLGKTLQAIGAAKWLMDHEDVERALIVCPASLKHQWAREIERFTGLQAQVIQGGPQARGAQYRRGPGLYIVNYELVLRDLSAINEHLRPDLVVLDEAQRIKNWRTKIASAIKLIPSRYAFVLTGTPLENRLEDLYSLMQVVDSSVLGPLWRYLIDFHVTDERGKVQGYRNLSELRRRLAPVMLRRDRRLVRDQLPERIEQRLDVALTPTQRELHGDAMKAAGLLAKTAGRRPLTPAEQKRLMAALQEARMACDAAGLVDKETQGSPKLDELASLLDELCLQSGLKAVVFSQWERMTVMVEDRLRGMGLGCVRLHGGVPTGRRGALIDRFRDDDAIQVFISTDAGGVGLNLQSASVLVNLDMPWNPAVLDQRIARVHRLGQRETVQVILMVAEESYEEQVLRLVQGKRDLFDNVVAADATEDVVGVSKKLLETLVADLAGEPEPAEAGHGDQAQSVAEEAAPGQAQPVAPGGEPRDAEVEAAIRRAIEAAQEAFGPRIERILGAGGGLLVVLDRVDEAADRLARQIGEEVPVALIDPRTLHGLERLGAASPVRDARPYYDVAEHAPEGAGSRLVAQAREKLEAAGVLIEQSCPGPAAELLGSALLAAAAARGEQEQAPGPAEAGVWIYGEALPRGWLTQEQAGVVMQGLALAQAPSVPAPLLQGLLDEARGFILTGSASTAPA